MERESIMVAQTKENLLRDMAERKKNVIVCGVRE